MKNYRYFLKLRYDGTTFHGWQTQENAHSVQQEIENALFTFIRKKNEITGCGRTDTGVHARVYFAHFDMDEPIADKEHFLFKLNIILPFSIAVQDVVLVNSDANARFDAVQREYKYYIHTSKNPFLTLYSYYFRTPLDVAKMNKAAQVLLTHSDFQCFSKSRTQVNNYNCTVSFAEWSEEGDSLVFTIRANRFLRNMVRAIVGTSLDIGAGNKEEKYMEEVIVSRDRKNAGSSVPACGLFLTDVVYPDNIFLNDVGSNR